ncbi:hypothetical protein [Flocculibacter collagenilyticus]|uniref:hypothetical protein n=1 Tax=Flocculibacter collagenilyticus TaxID=2744479 RepID=UPI0018F2D4A7|nr:hypothetical protein [Flocculibacter collagenilyticus]
MSWSGKDRRQSKEGANTALNWLSLLSWAVFVAALIVFHYARPELEYGLLKYWGISVREHWVLSLKDILFGLLVVCSCLSLLSMYYNKKRLRRKQDHFRYNFMLLFLVSVATMLSILV